MYFLTQTADAFLRVENIGPFWKIFHYYKTAANRWNSWWLQWVPLTCKYEAVFSPIKFHSAVPGILIAFECAWNWPIPVTQNTIYHISIWGFLIIASVTSHQGRTQWMKPSIRALTGIVHKGYTLWSQHPLD